jgi:hypothetical protein
MVGSIVLAKVSKDRLYQTFLQWDVPLEWAEIIERYLVNGFPPGGFFTALFANDAWGAIANSHPMNTISALKNLTGWIVNSGLEEAFGSYEIVQQWIKFDANKRREVLERRGVYLYRKRRNV